MKLSVFYSWQSDLPNKTNRSFIHKCLLKALELIYSEHKIISEFVIESDSRDETGTPELASTLFSKIDKCDIFISDISIINKDLPGRKLCNPNVLIELGYASSKIGWEKILCVFNLEYGKIENLPFDIRHRKPIVYKSTENKLTNVLISNIKAIIENHISNKKYFLSVKKEIDLSVQAIMIDLTKLLYFREVPKCYNYNLILHFSKEEIINDLQEKEFLGFQLLKNNDSHINEFIEFYNDQVYLNFLNEKEKNTLAKIILQFKNLAKLLANIEIYEKKKVDEKFALISAHKMNPENPENSYILIEKLKDKESIVLDSGEFKKSQLTLLLHYYKIKENYVQPLVETIGDLSFEINEWVRNSGDYFIFNERLLTTANNA